MYRIMSKNTQTETADQKAGTLSKQAQQVQRKAIKLLERIKRKEMKKRLEEIASEARLHH
jgi:hypothetical protein